MADDKKINLNPETSIDAAETLKQSGFDVEVDGKEVNIDENDTTLSLFPEVGEEEPVDGGDVKDVKVKELNKRIVKQSTTKSDGSKKTKKINKETFMSKKELLEAIGVYEDEAPVKTPTKTPTRKKPGRKSPFKPTIQPKPKATGEKFPDWLSAEVLGVGSNNPTPTKTPTKTPTRKKPGRKSPFKPTIQPKPKAVMSENKRKNKRK